MFGRQKHTVERADDAISDAPFQLQLAPGVIVVDAEIRDREALGVLIAGLTAFGALLPEKPPVTALPPPPVEPVAPPADVTPPALAQPPDDPPP